VPYLITGATGFIGSEVIARLLKNGTAPEEIFLIARADPAQSQLLLMRFEEHQIDASKIKNLKWVKAALDTEGSLARALNSLPAIKGKWRVGHFAALIATSRSSATKNLNLSDQKKIQTQVNVGATGELIAWANQFAELLVFTSSVVAFGGLDSPQIRSEKDFEHFPDECKTLGYFVSKREAHLKVASLSQIPTRIFCPGIVHGYLENFKPSRGHLKMIREGKLRVAPSGGGNFVGLDRVGGAIADALHSPAISVSAVPDINVRLLVDKNLTYKDYFTLYQKIYFEFLNEKAKNKNYRALDTQGPKSPIKIIRIPALLMNFIGSLAKLLPNSSPLKGKISETIGQSKYYLFFESEFGQFPTKGIEIAIRESLRQSERSSLIKSVAEEQ